MLLDHDDLLTPDALSANARRIERHEDVDYLYSDEDKVDDEGTLYDEFRKPDWSPERLRGQMYTSHLSVMRTEVVRRVGGFREGYDGSQDHDLALRVGEVARTVVHIPEVLYHWRAVVGSASADINAKPYATIAGAKAVQDHMDRLGLAASVGQGPVPGHYRITRRLDPAVRVSVVIPTIGQSDLIWGARRVMVVEAVRSLLARTSHANLEIVVVYDVPTPVEVLRELEEVAGDKLVLHRFTRPFNYSEKMNVGCLVATGDRLVFLNDDVEVISDGWLEQLVAPLDEPDVGMTGARLYFSDDTVQHAGHAYDRGHYLHPYRDLPRELLRAVRGVDHQPRGERRDGCVRGHAPRHLPRGRRLQRGSPGQLQRRRPVLQGGRPRTAHRLRRLGRALPLRVPQPRARRPRLGAQPRAGPLGGPRPGPVRARWSSEDCCAQEERLSSTSARAESAGPAPRSAAPLLAAAGVSGVAGYVVLVLAARVLDLATNASFLVFWGALYAVFGALVGQTTETTRAVFSSGGRGPTAVLAGAGGTGGGDRGRGGRLRPAVGAAPVRGRVAGAAGRDGGRHRCCSACRRQ